MSSRLRGPVLLARDEGRWLGYCRLVATAIAGCEGEVEDVKHIEGHTSRVGRDGDHTPGVFRDARQ